MGRQAQPLGGGFLVQMLEAFGRSLLLNPANANADNVAVPEMGSKGKNFFRRFHAEVANGVEDPQQGNAELTLAAPAAVLQAFKYGLKRLSSPVNHAHAHVHF